MNTSNKACAQCTDLALKNQPPKSGYGFLEATLGLIEQLPSSQDFITSVEELRNSARPGYSPRGMFRALCLKYLLNERHNVSLVLRLRGSPRLRKLCGFGEETPSESSFSRFFRRLTDEVEDIEQAITETVEHLHEHLPDIGEAVTIDGTDIEAYANPNRSAVIDQDATWGNRTMKNKSSNPSGNKNKESFFGYRLHLLGDVNYGVPLSYEFTPANVNDTVKLESVLDKALLDYSWLKPTHCIADRGYDSLSNHQAIHKRGIKPIIHIRKAINSTLHGDIYTTIGEPTCMGGNPMEYVRTDSTTGKHLYTCRPEGCHRLQMNLFPPTCRDWHWEDPNDNLRIISVVARASDEWKRMYKKRTVVERTFSSLKRSRLLGQHQYLTQSKIRAHVALSVLTYTATMLSRVLANDVENIRGMRLRV